MDITLQDVLVSVASFLVVYYFKELSGDVKSAVKSVQELNAKVGVILQNIETHSNEIEILREKQSNLVADVAHIKAHIEIKK
jgi:hypothetical protein